MKAAELVTLAEQHGAEVGRYEGAACWIKLQPRAIEALAAVLASGNQRSHVICLCPDCVKPRAEHDTYGAPPVGGWRPIETAPKDGSEVMLSNGSAVAEGHWLHDEGGITEHRDLEGRYIGQDESEGFDGWIDWSGGMIPEPTHWMPLPPAPGAGAPPVGAEKPWAQKTALEKAPSIIMQLEVAAERFTRYSHDTIDGLLQDATDVIRELAASPTPAPSEAVKGVSDRTDREWFEFCRPYVYLNGSHEMPNYAAICKAVLALTTPAVKGVSTAEPMRKHVEDFAAAAGWKREEGEGAFEFVQRTCYRQGWADGKREAVGDVHRDTPEPAVAVQAEPVAWLRDQRDTYEGRETLDPMWITGRTNPGRGINGATYSPLFAAHPKPAAPATADESDDEIWQRIKGIPFDWTGDSNTLIRYARAILALKGGA